MDSDNFPVSQVLAIRKNDKKGNGDWDILIVSYNNIDMAIKLSRSNYNQKENIV